ncbi:uncharacterized protein LOC110996377 [Pieris rapae]|uniref:uncharacterized protein LOC110996377 n=1 Tax=Pieris rapae TaxID=64459 RepID=UPI001E27B490|nr:uncharacterized protein LOC110996377 [Pieris rapae]
MNTTIVFLVLGLVVLASCAPRTKESDSLHLARRSPQYIKENVPGIKGNSRPPPNISLRKGEYMCGNKVCKLRPGEIPKGCNGICQYRV